MDRIEKIKYLINQMLLNDKYNEERLTTYNHLLCVSQFCALIAKKRKLNSELATIAGLLHDIYYFKTLEHFNHAHLSAELARDILEDFNIATDDEIKIISNAIYHHSDKENTHNEFDEMLKDADVLQHNINNLLNPVLFEEEIRYQNLIREFGL